MTDKRANESFAELFKNPRAVIVVVATAIIFAGLGAAFASSNLLG